MSAKLWWYTYIVVAVFVATLNKANSSYQLPKDIKPISYNIIVEPNFDGNYFNGSVVIELKCLIDTNNITLHARNLNIDENNVTVIHSSKSEIKVANVTVDESKDFYTINLKSQLLKNESYNLTIGQYSGELKFDNVGFYLAKYIDKSGVERILALTDFQPNGARKAFPCFDEPALKAKFSISIIRPKDYISVSNEKLISSEEYGNDQFKDIYEETVEMSTYLVAFAVCTYEHTHQNGRFRIFARPEAIDTGQVDYVLSFSESLLNEMEDFTGINYTLDKLDLFGVPTDYFEPGGMENWGLVTYSESNLFCSNFSTFDLQKCLSFTAHEIAHQWFGNLVTPNWWTYLWLSEGFATYLQYYIPSLLRPSWKLMDQFALIIQQKALDYDGKTILPSLNQQHILPGGLPSTVIAYYKGACIIGMLQHFLTEDVFNQGVKQYVSKHKFGAVESTDLYNAFQTVIDEYGANELIGNISLSSVMKSWTSVGGYPLINVMRDYENGSVTFSQEKFSPKTLFEFTHTWVVPINYVLYSGGAIDFSKTVADFWLTTKSITLENLPVTGWLLVNKQQTGYFRVNYDTTNWNLLISFLNTDNFTDIHSVNRAQLIDDAFALAQKNYISYDIPLTLSQYLHQEKEYVPLAMFLNIMDNLNMLMTSAGKYQAFKRYLIDILLGPYNYLGNEEKEEDTHLDRLLRIDLITWMCRLGYPECLKAGLDKLKEWKINNETSYMFDLEYPLFCGALQVGDEEDWNFIYSQYNTIQDFSRRNKLRLSLGCTQNETLQNRFLDIVFDTNNTLSLRERQMAFTEVVKSGDKGLQAALTYVTKNVVKMNEIFYKTKVGVSLGKYITTKDDMESLQQIYNSTLDRQNIIPTTLRYARKNLDQISEESNQNILKWFQKYEENSLGNMVI